MNIFSCLRRQKFIVYKFIFNTFCCSNVGCKFFQKIHLPREEKDLRHYKSFQQMSTSTQKLFHESTVSQKYIVVIKYSKLNWSNWSQSFCTMEIQWSGEIKRKSLAYAFVKHCEPSCLKLIAQGRSYYFDTTKRITLLWKISRVKLTIPAQTKQVVLILQNCVFKSRSTWEQCSTYFFLGHVAESTFTQVFTYVYLWPCFRCEPIPQNIFNWLCFEWLLYVAQIKQ